MATTKELLEMLDPKMRGYVMDFLTEINANEKYKYIIIETLRSEKKQKALYAQGRESLEVVNKLRADAGLPEISDKENLRVVTKTLNSRHFANKDGFAEAFDIVAFDRQTGEVFWVDEPKRGATPYLLAYNISAKYPFRAGFAWGWDLGHYEFAKQKGVENEKD